MGEHGGVPPADQPRRDLAAPARPDDDGAADPQVTAALARLARTPDDGAARVEALTALAGTRLLVPVVATADEVVVDEAGLAHDKSSDMATVMLTGADGRLALLAFTGLASLERWDASARPVPVAAPLAAQAALQDGAAALLLDLAGPERLVLEADDLLGLARGWRPALVGDDPVWIGSPPE
jgi:hypothetical protein